MVWITLNLNFHLGIQVSQASDNIWEPIKTEGIYGGVVRTIAINPQDTTFLFTGLKGGGIFRRENGVQPWTESNAGLNSLNIIDIEFDPNNPEIIYAGTEKGLYKSTNSGMTWECKLFQEGMAQINDVLVDSVTSNIYVAVGQLDSDTPKNKLLAWSYDGGETWSSRQFGSPSNPVEIYCIAKIDYDESDIKKPGPFSIYIGTSRGIWISHDGITWPEESHQNDLKDRAVYAFAIHPTNHKFVYAGCDNGILFSPKYGNPGDPDEWEQDFRHLKEIHITCLAIDNTFLYAGTLTKGLLRNDASVANHTSRDWKTLGFTSEQIYQIKLDKRNPNWVYVATSTGIYKSTDAGDNWAAINTGINCAKINQFIVTGDNPQYYIAAQSGGYRSHDAISWEAIPQLPQREMLTIYIHPKDQNYIFAGYRDYAAMSLSQNGGSAWIEKSLKENCNINVFAASYNNENFPTVYAGTNKGLWQISEHNATKIDSGFGNIISIAVNEKQNPETIYIGTEGNGLWQKQAGQNKIRINNGLASDATVNSLSIAYSTTGEESLFVGTNSGLFYRAQQSDQFKKIGQYFLNKPIKTFSKASIPGMPSLAALKNDGVIRTYQVFSEWDLLNNGREDFGDLFNSITRSSDSATIFYATTDGGQIFQFRAASQIEVSPEIWDFGKVRAGRNASRKIMISNSGEWPLIVRKDSTQNSLEKRFRTPSLNLPLKILPRKSAEIEIYYYPTGRRADTATVPIYYENGQTKGIRVHGQGTAPAVSISPVICDFGTINIGDTTFQKISLVNKGDEVLNFQLSQPVLDCFDITPVSGTLKLNEPFYIQASFSSLNANSVEEKITLTCTDSLVFEGQSEFILKGLCESGPIIQLCPSDLLLFPAVRKGATIIQPLCLKNIGNDTVHIANIIVPEPFSIDSFPPYLPVGTSDTIYINFSSMTVDNFGRMLQVRSPAYGDKDVLLSANCVQGPIIKANPQEINFDTVYVNGNAVRTLEITNTGDDTLRIQSIQVDGTPGISVEPANPLNVRIPSDSVFSFRFTWEPRQKMQMNSICFIESNAVAGDSIIRLTGTAVAPVFDWPAIVDFDSIRYQTDVTRVIHVPYIGAEAPLNFEIVKTGPDAAAFEISCPNQIGIDETLLVEITFSPREPGKYWLQLEINSQTPFHGNRHISLTGKGLFNPVLKVEPIRHHFGEVRVQDSTTKRFEFTNIGQDTLKISSIWLEPWRSYQIEDYPERRLNPGQATTMTIKFKPDSLGFFPSDLHIETNVLIGNTIIPLDGEGVAPEIEVLDRIDFGNVTTNTTENNTLSIFNRGKRTLTIDSITFESPSGCFEIGSVSVPFELNSGQRKSFTASFSPAVNGPDSALISIKSNAYNGNSANILLYGFGVASGTLRISFDWTQYDPLPKGKPATLVAQLSDAIATIDTAKIYFRKAGVSTYSEVAMLAQDNASNYLATIPGESITMQGLEYKIEVANNTGNSSKNPEKFYHSARVYVEDEIELNSKTQPTGNGQNDYRMISFPFQLDRDDAKLIMEKNLGAFEHQNWNMVDFGSTENGESKFIFLDDPYFSDIIPGKGFWLLVSKPNVSLNTVGIKATTIYTNQAFRIDLKPEWNIMGNPFNFPIPIQQICWQGSAPLEIRSFANRWNDVFACRVDTLFPWEGYAVKVPEPGALMIYPAPELIPEGSTCFSENPPVDWSIRICAIKGDTANVQNYLDVDNYLGTSPACITGHDDLDFSEPPPMGRYIQLSFPHPEWDDYAGNYCTDFRPALSEGDYWDFQLQTNIPDTIVSISLTNIRKIPESFQVYLIDKDLKNCQKLEKDAIYSLLTGSQPITRNFRLVVGTEPFFENNNLGAVLPPQAIKLFDIFPNPFNSRTTFYFTLPAAATVTIEIYNVLGQQVKQLMNNIRKEEGYHVVFWDGMDSENQSVPSGVYLCKFNCGNYLVLKKMMVLR